MYIFRPGFASSMRYFTPIALIVLVIAIMVGGSYDHPGVAQTALRLVPTVNAQPELIVSTLGALNGIKAVNLSRVDQRLLITYDKGRISLADLHHILISLGYHSVPIQDARVRASM